MAEIDRDRKKKGMGWMWGLLALLLVALLAWWMWPDDDAALGDVDAGAEVVPITPVTPEPVAEAPLVSVGEVLADPEAYVGQEFPSTELSVADVPTDRGFWVEQDGQRLFALIADQPQEQPLNIEPGQTLRIEQGMLRDATFLANLPGAPLDADTRQILEQQEVFLVVNEANIEVVLESGGTG